ncbi:hypothetical protein NCCP2716_27550 [Sporosarcina sp. NCCP-2716]|nr:hypothetical protein NCCP2716_27550 [Sporosarcina sp. NCCP-2716]
MLHDPTVAAVLLHFPAGKIPVNVQLLPADTLGHRREHPDHSSWLVTGGLPGVIDLVFGVVGFFDLLPSKSEHFA